MSVGVNEVASALAILVIVVGFLRWLWTRKRKPEAPAPEPPPKVSIAADVSLDRNEFPPDRYSKGWGRSRNLRYTVVEIRNVRTAAMTIAGVKLEFDGQEYPVWLAATNEYRELLANEPTHVYFEVTKYGAPRPKRVTVRWIGGEHIYESFPQAEGWTDQQGMAH